MSEQDLQKKIILYLESIGCYVIKVISANKNGVPDLVFMHKGKFCAIEVKAKGKLNTVSRLQQYHIDKINSNGGYAFASDSLEEVRQLILL